MKILVFTHKLEVGGVQVNTIELSAALRDTYGHDVVLFATPGSMVEEAEKRGLRFLAAPVAKRVPSLSMMRALREVVRRERPDVMHVWDWPQAINSFYAVHLSQGIPVVVSDMVSAEAIVRFLPRTVLTTFGTPEFVDRAKAAGRKRVELLLPPVDTYLNAPHIVDLRPFCQRNNIEAGSITLVTVSRLVDMKLESLYRTIQAIRVLGHELPLRFIIVGDGTSRTQIERLAAEANRELKRTAVTMIGELLDPRPAYAAADIVIGMGGSALRGAAFGKPVIVVGANGFSAPLTPETAPFLHYHGIYGIGHGCSDNSCLIGHIRTFAEVGQKLQTSGTFSRQFVLEHFSLEKVSAQLEALCRNAVSDRRRLADVAVDGLRTAALLKLGALAPEIVRRVVKKVEASRVTRLTAEPQGRWCYPAVPENK